MEVEFYKESFWIDDSWLDFLMKTLNDALFDVADAPLFK